MATRACIGSRIDGGNIEDDEKEEASGKIHFYKIKALGFYFLLGRLGCGSLVFIYFYHFNHLRVQFIGIKYIHIIVQPSPLFVSRIFSSSHAETLCPLNNNSPSSPPSAPRKPCSLFYFWIWLFQVYHIRGIILDWPTNSGFSTRRYRETQTNFLANPTQYLSFCVWHVSLSIVFKFYPCRISSVQFISVAQSCPTLCDPMNSSMPGLPVHHQLPEFAQTDVHRVNDAIQPSHPLSSPSPPAPNPSQHQDLFQWVNSSHEVAKVLEFQLQHQSFQRTPRTDLL